MKNFLLLLVFLFSFSAARSQQIPYYTQYRHMDLMVNPAFTGTKNLIDARISYRKQWAGFSGAPLTQTALVNSRFMKGKMGAGIFFENDETGPSERQSFGANYAFHIRFPDVELSLGLNGSMMKYFLRGDRMLIHNSQDPAIDQSRSDFSWLPNAGFGVLLFNDRFHFGVSAQNLIQTKAEFYKDDTLKKGLAVMSPHYFFNVGYNIRTGPQMIWEHNLQTFFIKASPLGIDYNLKLHFNKKIFAGLNFRLKDAFALMAGYTWKEMIQICYSYDLVTSKLRSHQSGSHEVSLIYRTDLTKFKRYHVNPEFLRQKYDWF